MISALLINDVPIECINQAAQTYIVPAVYIISVLRTENGRVGMASRNDNRTFDYGPMQINSIWLDKLKPYGITREQLQFDPCINVQVGTWILAQSISNGASLWSGVGDYHSHNIEHNVPYRYKVSSVYRKVMMALNAPDAVQ